MVTTTNLSYTYKNEETLIANLRGEIIRNTPLGRIASAEEVAQAAQFLCSEASTFVTGEIMIIDGGRSLLDPVQIAAH